MRQFEYLNKHEQITFIFQNIQALIAIIGIIGNMLAFAVFLRKPLRNHSYAFYFQILAWTDSFVLIHAFRHWLRIVADYDVDLLGEFFCRFNEFQPFFASSTSFWIRLLIIFDRLIRVVYPEYFRIIRRKWFLFTAVLILFLYNGILHLILPFNYRLVTIEQSDNSTRLICFLPMEIHQINYIISLINITICASCTIVLDYKLISYIFYSRKNLRNKLYKPHSSVIKDRKFAKSSICISLMNVCCQLIFVTSTLIALSLNLNRDQIELVFTASVTIAIFNSSSVLFLNMFMNSIFFKEFQRLFGCRKKRQS